MSTISQDSELVALAASGNCRARDALVRANMGFVVSCAKRYVGHGLDLPDLVQEGIIGLLRALPKFDPARGVPFMAFAYYDVRNAVLHAINECGGNMRLPDRHLRKLIKVNKALPSVADIQNRAELLRALSERTGLDVQEISRLLALSHPAEPLEPSLRADAYSPSAEDEYFAKWSAAQVRQAVRALPQKERDVVVAFYGLDGTRTPQSFAQIAARNQKTRAWASSVEKRARRHLAARLPQ